MRNIDSRSVRVLDSLMTLDDSDFAAAEEPGRKLLVEAFFKVVPEIHRYERRAA